MSGHTAGPWDCYEPSNGQLWVTAGPRPNGVRKAIATVWTPDGDGVQAVRAANGAIIAAGPCLLAYAECERAWTEFLRSVLPAEGLNETFKARGWDGIEDESDFLARIRRAAIAKATGVGTA